MEHLTLNHIYNGDCVKILKDMPSESVDVCFADPPFNLKKLYDGYADDMAQNAYIFWCKQWITELIRITKPEGSIFIHNIPMWLFYYQEAFLFKAHFKHWISWDAPTSPMGKSLQPAHYGILYFSKEKKNKFHEIRVPHKTCRTCNELIKDYGGKKSEIHPFGPLASDVWTDIHRVKHEKYRNKEHPCQLPIHLLERIVLMSSDEGDTILDCFMGTGTTALAAKRLGRNYVGIDQSQEYIDIAEERLAKETKLSKLGDAYVSYFKGDIVTLRNEDWPVIMPLWESSVQNPTKPKNKTNNSVQKTTLF